MSLTHGTLARPGAFCARDSVGANSAAGRVALVTDRYRGLGRAKLLAFVAAVRYVLSTVDLVPELFLPLIGLGDDVVVVLGLAALLLIETERYLRYTRDAGQ